MTALQIIFNSEITHRLGWVLVHFLWQGALVAAVLAGVLTALRKKSANARYAAACCAMLAMVILPAVTILFIDVPSPQTNTAVILDAPADSAGIEEAAIVADALEPGKSVTVPVLPGEIDPTKHNCTRPLPGSEGEPFAATAAPEAAASFTTQTARALDAALPWMTLTWALGVFGLSLWHLGGWAQLQRLRRRMIEPVAPDIRLKVLQLAERIGVTRTVETLQSALVAVPAVVGHFKPVILLPASAMTGLSPEQIEAILAHELAHIKRCDYLVNMLQTAVEILGFYHPGVWWVSRVIRIERENCCDDIAVAVCQDRVTYARALAAMEEVRGHGRLAVAASGASLFDRIRRLLGADDVRESRFNWAGAVVILLLLGMLSVPVGLAMSKGIHAKEPAGEPAPLPEYIHTLDNGVTVELVGVCNYPSQGKQWWRPDGSPLGDTIETVDGSGYRSDKPGYEIAFQVHNREKCHEFGIADIANGGQRSGLRVNDEDIFAVYRAHIRKGIDRTDVTVQVAGDLWQSIAELEGFGYTTSRKYKGARILFSSRVDSDGTVVVSVSDELSHTVATRLMAVTRDGKTIRGRAQTSMFDGTGGEILRLQVLRFEGVKPSEIEKLSYEICPYEYYTFENVTLKPNFKPQDVPAESQKYSRKLDNGVSIELLAVSEFPGEGMPWWSPDGSQTVYNFLTRSRATLATGGKAYRFAVQVDGPEDLTFRWAGVKGTRGMADLEVLGDNEESPAGIEAARFNIKEGLKATDMQLAAAAGPWTTQFEHNGSGTMSSSRRSHAIAFSKAYQTGKDVELTVSDDYFEHDYRLVAIGKDGQIITTKNRNSNSAGKVRQSTFRFIDTKLEDIEKFEFQTRPFESVTFKNVSLRPKFKTDAEIEREEQLSSSSPEASDIQEMLKTVELKAADFEEVSGFTVWLATQPGVKNVRSEPLNYLTSYPAKQKVHFSYHGEEQTVYYTVTEKPDVVLLDETKINNEDSETVSQRAQRLQSREDSLRNLSNLGSLLRIYAKENNEKYPDTLEKLKPYDGDGLLPRAVKHAGYLGRGKTLASKPQTPIAYDKTMLMENGKTNVLFHDGHVEFCEQRRLKALGIEENKVSDTFHSARMWVEDFFKNNYRDITERKTLEWGEPIKHENGNVSIRYKYEAVIWGKEKIIEDKVWMFDKDGNFLSVEDVSKVSGTLNSLPEQSMQTGQEATDNSLIAHWDFEQDAMDKVGGHHGTVYGAVPGEGISGRGYYFEGDGDCIAIPDSPAFDFGHGDCTVSCWFRTGENKEPLPFLVNFRRDDNNPHIELYAGWEVGSHLLPGDTRVVYPEAGINDDKWHHLAATLENGAENGYRLYLDGVKVAQNTYAGRLEDWDTLTIGARKKDSGPRFAFKGFIDEVRVYNRALAAEEIAGMYHAMDVPHPAKPAPQVQTRRSHTNTNEFILTDLDETFMALILETGELIDLKDRMAGEQVSNTEEFMAVIDKIARPLVLYGGSASCAMLGFYKCTIHGQPVEHEAGFQIVRVEYDRLPVEFEAKTESGIRYAVMVTQANRDHCTVQYEAVKSPGPAVSCRYFEQIVITPDPEKMRYKGRMITWTQLEEAVAKLDNKQSTVLEVAYEPGMISKQRSDPRGYISQQLEGEPGFQKAKALVDKYGLEHISFVGEYGSGDARKGPVSVRMQGTFEEGKDIPLNLQSFEDNPLLTIRSLAFERKGSLARVKCAMTSYPFTTWQVMVCLLDEDGYQLASEARGLDNKGIAAGVPANFIDELEFNFGRVDIDAIDRFEISLRQYLPPEEEKDKTVSVEAKVLLADPETYEKILAQDTLQKEGQALNFDQAASLIREINAGRHSKLLSAPKVTVRDGENATLSVRDDKTGYELICDVTSGIMGDIVNLDFTIQNRKIFSQQEIEKGQVEFAKSVELSGSSLVPNQNTLAVGGFEVDCDRPWIDVHHGEGCKLIVMLKPTIIPAEQ